MVTSTNYNKNDEDQEFSDPEDFVDDISDEELLPELMQKEPKLDKSTDKIIVIDNIPKVGQDKQAKLKQILQKLLANYGTIVNEYYPEENGILKGYFFVEFSTDISAQEAQLRLNDHPLDKNHKFKVNFFSDFEKYQNLNIDTQDDTPLPYKDPGNLMWWLTTPECFDQFGIFYGEPKTLSVFLNTPTEAQLLETRMKWAETRFQWSPKGVYLATFHDKGIALWASENFKQFMRFNHQGVQFIDFSPCEKYLVTFNPNKAGVDERALIIWCTRTGYQHCSFSLESTHNTSWPIIRWSNDDTYFARLATDTLLVYETETFALLNKKRIKIPHIQDFEWSPTNNYISYWVAEDKNVLARVVLLEIPSKNEIRSKNLVNVSECKMYWQASGDYVCVRVDRYKKLNVVKDDDKENQIRYSGIYHNFELFRIREKQIPVDSIEIKETFQSFAWEPNGQKFCIIYGEGTGQRNAAFYRIEKATNISAGKLELIKELKNKTVSQIYWSPQGQHCVLATTASKSQGQTCIVEFYDVSSTDVQLINKTEQDHMTDIEWDPTGRFLVTYVSYWNFRSENAYILWNFQGRLIQRINKEKLYKFSWRPRPPTLLSADQLKEIRKNLKQYSDRYSKEDQKYMSKVSQELIEKRKNLMSDFNLFKREASKRLEQQRQKKIDLRGYDTDNLNIDNEEIEYTVQFLVDSKKEEIIE